MEKNSDKNGKEVNGTLDKDNGNNGSGLNGMSKLFVCSFCLCVCVFFLILLLLNSIFMFIFNSVVMAQDPMFCLDPKGSTVNYL